MNDDNTKPEINDNSIIDMYFGRDEQAIRVTSEKYGKLCFRVAHNILGSREDAEEVVNDAYLAAWESIPPAKPESLRAFVCRITRNHALKRLDYNTVQKRMPKVLLSFAELEEMIPDNAQQPDISASELGELINEFLKTQSADARCVFVRRYYFFDSIYDIAKKYSFGESKVKTLLSRTRKKLKDYLNKEGYFI